MTDLSVPKKTTQRRGTATHKVRFVTATSLFDGHDASINVMRRILQASGAEVIHLGHNRAVEEIVRDIRGRGTTIIMTTHNLVQAKRMADDVLFLHAGRITERTPAWEFFTMPRSIEAVNFLEGERI